jgi:low temperature requirement protein LtrA
VLIFIPVWWAWVGFTMFVNRYGEDHATQRIVYFIQMIFVIVLTVSINTDFEKYFLAFMLSYVGIRLCTVFMYARLWMQRTQLNGIPRVISVGFFIGAMISFSSIWFMDEWKFIMLYAGILFDMIYPLFHRKRFKRHPINNHHLLERFGLITLIVMGESVVSIANTIRETPMSSHLVITALSGFMIIVTTWWHYFTYSDKAVDRHRVSAGHGILYGHLVIFLSLGVMANVIRYGINLELELDAFKWFAVAAIVLYAMASFFIFQYQADAKHKRNRKWILAYLSILLLWCVAIWLMPAILYVMIALTVITLISVYLLVRDLGLS